jgi:hypothetical protein
VNATFRIVCGTVPVAALTSLPSHALIIENATFAKSITIGQQRLPLHSAAPLRWQKLVKA